MTSRHTTPIVAALTERMQKVLEAIVKDYIETAEPVGSRIVTRRHGVKLSPATVRNVMSDLEDLGLLTQPHTSAGRVPTDTGIRYFIDTLLRVRHLSGRERDRIRARYALSTGGVQELLHESGRILSALTRMTGIVMAPAVVAIALKHIEFVKLRGGRVLAVLVSQNGLVENRLVEVAFEISDSELERIGNFLNTRFANRSLAQIRVELENERDRLAEELADLAAKAELLSKAAFESLGRREVVVEGRSHIFAHPEFANSESGRAIMDALRVLEERERLMSLIERTLNGQGIRIFIGAETEISELEGLSLVFRAYGDSSTIRAGAEGAPERDALGVVGVIGPRRMDYARVVPLVDYTAELVGDLLGEV